MCFRAYIDTQMSDAPEIARLLESAVNSDIEDDMGSPVNVAFGLSLKQRPKVSPTGEMDRALGVRYCRWARIRGYSVSRAISKMRYPTSGRAF